MHPHSLTVTALFPILTAGDIVPSVRRRLV